MRKFYEIRQMDLPKVFRLLGNKGGRAIHVKKEEKKLSALDSYNNIARNNLSDSIYSSSDYTQKVKAFD